MDNTINLQVVDKFQITPSDTDLIVDQGDNPRGYTRCGLYLEQDSTLKVRYSNGNITTEVFLAGYHPISITRVYATGSILSGNLWGTITNG